MIDPHKPKYHDLYWRLAFEAAQESVATRKQVGAVLVMPTGMLSIGWNGMPAGFSNTCEYWEDEHIDPVARSIQPAGLVTRPEVIHAERNAIDKMTRQGVPTQGSILFVTHRPCFECSKAIHGLGLKAVYYAVPSQRNNEGLRLLEQAGVPCYHTPRNHHDREEQAPHRLPCLAGHDPAARQ